MNDPELNKEVIDTQLFGENVSFLEKCFDSTLLLQNSLVAKEYFAEEKHEHNEKKRNKQYISMRNSLQLNKTLDVTLNLTKPVLSQNVLNRNLRSWGLPHEIASKYEQRGITEMFEWQATCLSNPKVLLECSNLVYSAPTSAGKTLVAEILTIKTILERQKKVIIILPFVSIVREKTFYLQDILSSSGIRVEGFVGSQAPPGGLQAVHVAICTIEKANSLVNRLLDDGNISELGAVIVDELHLLGDPHRGYILELLLTKIKFVTSKSTDIIIQIVGMSATLPNLEILAKWLSSDLFITKFRPIPLDEYCLAGTKLYDKNGKCLKTLNSSLPESDNVLNICLETIKESCSILIFCMTKNRCESLAQSLASSFFNIGCQKNESGTVLREQLKTDSISEVLEQLKNCPVGLDQVLKKTISFGVAYHHAGLTFDERDIIEGAFKTGAIRVLVATSTLSSGVNLPARKVIIRSPVFQRQPINILTYKQMIGRAGRMGKDTKGESILICTENEKTIGFQLMMGALDPVRSCIQSGDKYMRAVLEMIASQVVSTKDELELYSQCTLLYTQQSDTVEPESILKRTLDDLVNYELVRIQKDGDEINYVATPLGKACLSASMAPNDGLSLFVELQKARQCLVLEADLHLIYLVTPYSVSSQWENIDWLHLLTLYESMTKAMKNVANLVGIQESYIIRCLRGQPTIHNSLNKTHIHKRFYTALALQDLVNEVPLSDVAAKFNCARGFLQSLQQAAATFAGMVTAFCRQLGWKNMEILIAQFQDRLHFGVHSELLDLMKLSSMNGVRARALFDSGFDTVSSIASADVNSIENILYKAVPFQSEKEREGDHEDDVKRRNKVKSIWITGCCGMTAKEAAQNLIIEARKLLKAEIGVTEIVWNKINSSQTVNDDINNGTKNHGNGQIEETASNEIQDLIEKSQKSIKETKTRVSDDFLENTFEPCTNANDNKKSVDNVNLHNVLKINREEFATNRILETQKQSTPIVSDATASSAVKDDIVWDSLNFTETAIQNVTKFHNNNNNKTFSPNISFGETDKSSSIKVDEIKDNHTSTKDVSLFSTDGDSSIFEESLPLDLIPSKLLDSKTPSVTVVTKEMTADFVNLNSDTILNVFKSPLKVSDNDDDLKLFYEEDLQENEVASSQETKSIKDYRSPYKRSLEDKGVKQQAKKKKIDMYDSFTSKLNLIKSMKITVHINNELLNCIILKDVDIINNLHLLDNIEVESIYLIVSQNSYMSEVIGSNIVKTPKKDKDEVIKGIALHLSDKNCLYIDIISIKNEMDLVKNALKTFFQKETLALKMFSLKSYYFILKKWLGICLPHSCESIILLDWLIQSDERVPSIENLTKKYCSIDLTTVSIKVDNKRKMFKRLDQHLDACIKAWCLSKISKQIMEKGNEIYRNIIARENQIATILAECEYHGIMVDRNLASRMLTHIKQSQEILQKKGNKLAGCQLNMNSTKCVAKALGINKHGKVSTKKSVLSCHSTPLASVVMYWRKLNCILTKTLYPLTEKAFGYSEGNRISSSYTMHTCTGRISMHEPNLQNVPRTFIVPGSYLDTAHPVEFNCRNIFQCSEGFVMVSADYCQLEMRILTHFSEDSVLVDIMRSDVDVFKSIAASWSGVLEDEVDDDLRQKAKQLCYGILYGMGNKTLAQHLDVTEIEAAFFMDSFYKTFPDVKKYTHSVIEECRKKGFVETLMKRRRYLTDIKSNISAARSAAERQAVNTKIQGSAADIAKEAMCAIDNKTNVLDPKPRLLLQMHDELIYEVRDRDKEVFIKIMKEAMEQTVKLKVPLPVKVKTGNTWGSLK